MTFATAKEISLFVAVEVYPVFWRRGGGVPTHSLCDRFIMRIRDNIISGSRRGIPGWFPLRSPFFSGSSGILSQTLNEIIQAIQFPEKNPFLPGFSFSSRFQTIETSRFLSNSAIPFLTIASSLPLSLFLHLPLFL